MKSNAEPDILPSADQSLADARIDWGQGRVIGYSVPADQTAFDVVHLYLDERRVLSAVANLSVFELSRDLAGMKLPAREQSAFVFRIPQGSLLPGHVGTSGPRLEVRTSQGQKIYAYDIQGPQELLRLTEGTPSELLFEVELRTVQGGSVHGIVRDRYGTGVRPALQVRLNDQPPEPLSLYESSSDGRVHYFSVPLRADRLVTGTNNLHVLGNLNQPLASYPIQLGSVVAGESDRRIAALEAEVSFLKHLVLNQNTEALPARLAVLKGEIVNICSDMLALQRTNLEREFRGSAPAPAPAPAAAPLAATPPARPTAAPAAMPAAKPAATSPGTPPTR